MKKLSFVMLALIFVLSLAAGCTPAPAEVATEAVAATEAVQPTAVPDTAVPAGLAGQQVPDAVPVVVADVVAAEHGTLRGDEVRCPAIATRLTSVNTA